MASRVLKMLAANCDSKVPAAPVCSGEDVAIREKTLAAVAAMRQAIDEMRLDRGLAEVHEAVGEANRYFDKMAPWKLVKEGKTEELHRVLYHAAECLRIVSGLLWPVMPGKMRELRLALGLTEAEVVPTMADLSRWGGFLDGRSTSMPGSLFPRIEVEKVPAAAPVPKAEKPKKEKPVAAPAEMIEIADFTKVSLKTARVLAAETVPDADKLLKLQVEIGGETRQIVAGIAKFYTPEQMVGRIIIVVANLKPAVLRGVESQGMLLAAKTGKDLRLVTVDGDIATGASVG
jgi:methionyl-tRNA synthetase